MDTISISQTIVQHTISEEGGKDTVGGDIIHLSDLLGELLYVHASLNETEDDFDANLVLTENVLNTTNHLFSSIVGWEEISQNDSRYKSSSNLLSATDSVGYLLFKQSNMKNRIINADYTGYNFTGSDLNMNAAFWKESSVLPTGSHCFTFDNTEICVPQAAYDDTKDEEIIEVSVQYKLGVDSYLFPNTISSEDRVSSRYNAQLQGNRSLSSYLIGLAVNNGTVDLKIPSDDPVIITLNHESSKVK